MEPHPSFREAFTPEVKSQLVDVLHYVVEAASENFAAVPDLTTGMTFGVDTYQFANQRLLHVAQQPDSPLEARFVENAFRCFIGEWTFGIYRVGRKASDNIWESFPNPGNSAGAVGGAYLPGMEPDDQNTRGAILAYMCNPEDGLGAAYLCIPRTDEAGRITEWSYVEEIYRREEGPRPGAGGTEDSAPPELVDAVNLKRRTRGATRAG